MPAVSPSTWTIASRCQQFSFRSVDYDELVSRMRWICEQEGIQTDEEALGILAHVGEGSVRDSLSALDQAIACCGNTLNATDLRSLMGLFSVQSLQEAYTYAEKRYNAGLTSSLEFLTATNNLTRAKIDSLQARYDLIFRVKVLDFYAGRPLAF